MYMPEYATHPSGDYKVEQAQSNLRAFLLPLASNPLVKGVHITGVAVIIGSNSIQHNLGTTPIGWVVTRLRGGAAVLYETAITNQSITLTSSAAAVVDLWVF